MSSKVKSKHTSIIKYLSNKELFYIQVSFLLVTWVVYRTLFNFQPWFDETFGKAVFYGLPILVYVSISGYKKIADSLSTNKIKQGLMLGLALGGIFGFVGTIGAASVKGSVAQTSYVFLTLRFWQEFALALMTAFWETVFFFSFIMNVFQKNFKKLSKIGLILGTAGIFLIFHIPNMILRADSFYSLFSQLYLLSLFGIGQTIIFYVHKNAYVLIISHAIWGMVMLVHLS
jgi:hypothetical protein